MFLIKKTSVSILEWIEDPGFTIIYIITFQETVLGPYICICEPERLTDYNTNVIDYVYDY